MNFVFNYMNLPLPESVERLHSAGYYREEMKLIDKLLLRGVNDFMRARLIAQHRIASRIAAFYPLTRKDAVLRLTSKIGEFDDEKLARLIDDNMVDWIFVEGEQRFRRNIYENLIAADSPYTERTESEKAKHALLNETFADMRRSGSVAIKYTVRTGLAVNADTAGETLRVHLPFVKPGDNISDITLLRTSPDVKLIGEPESSHRTIFFESTEQKDFFAEYSFVSESKYGIHFNSAAEHSDVDFCLDEQLPHIMFTPLILAAADEIVGSERNPLAKARLIYEWITANINYSFMRPYYMVPNLSEYALLNRRGDCGVQSLLFITLCRAVGVPAAWESGLFIDGEATRCHDWARFYVEPWGWMRADCSFGGSAKRLGDEQRRELYFGNIDPYRVVLADEFMQPFEPNKQFFRVDPTDNQRGEAETDRRALSEDDFTADTVILSAERLK